MNTDNPPEVVNKSNQIADSIIDIKKLIINQIKTKFQKTLHQVLLDIEIELMKLLLSKVLYSTAE